VSKHTNPSLDDVTIHQLSFQLGHGELTSLYSLIAFSLISATLSVGTWEVASSDGTVDVDAGLIEIAEVRAILVLDRSAANGNTEGRISTIYPS